jgi:hypothetical protein
MRDLMPLAARPAIRLARRGGLRQSGGLRGFGGPRRPGDRGVIGVLVAMLVGSGVLVGMGALVIDLGQVYQNRAELQNGADAGALAVASSCARGGPCTLTTALPLATHYASANASGLTGHRAAIGLVCGSGLLGPCLAGLGGITGCPPAPPAGTNYVDVHTATLTGSGSGVLPPLFSGVIGSQGSDVKACAQAEWGSPASATVAAFTISACSWYAYTGGGTLFAAPPPYPPDLPPAAPADHVLTERGTRGARATGCPPYEPYGQDAPGTFGWTTDAGNCSAFVGGGGTVSYGGRTGTQATADCASVLQSAQAGRSVVYVPVYSSVRPAVTGVTYTLLGFAAFVITGYHLGAGPVASDWLNPANNCTGGKFCIDGYFTRGLIPSTGALGGTDLGASIVKLTG